MTKMRSKPATPGSAFKSSMLLLGLFSFLISFLAMSPADAKGHGYGKGKYKVPPGQVNRYFNGNPNKTVPPGQMKKFYPGYKKHGKGYKHKYKNKYKHR